MPATVYLEQNKRKERETKVFFTFVSRSKHVKTAGAEVASSEISRILQKFEKQFPCISSSFTKLDPSVPGSF